MQLSLNGKKLPVQQPNDKKRATWKVFLQPGANLLQVTAVHKGVRVTDQTTIEYRLLPKELRKDWDGSPLAVNVGSASQYIDPAGEVWVDDRPYTSGSFGHIGGKLSWFNRKEVITHTQDEPLFYSFQDSIQAYRFDVPDGHYRITLRFAEPAMDSKVKRHFTVGVASAPALRWEYPGSTAIALSQAWSKTLVAEATNNKGIQVDFYAQQGNTLLNGIRIERINE
mgnify:CR=1 FL=1